MRSTRVRASTPLRTPILGRVARPTRASSDSVGAQRPTAPATRRAQRRRARHNVGHRRGGGHVDGREHPRRHAGDLARRVNEIAARSQTNARSGHGRPDHGRPDGEASRAVARGARRTLRRAACCSRRQVGGEPRSPRECRRRARDPGAPSSSWSTSRRATAVAGAWAARAPAAALARRDLRRARRRRGDRASERRRVTRRGRLRGRRGRRRRTSSPAGRCASRTGRKRRPRPRPARAAAAALAVAGGLRARCQTSAARSGVDDALLVVGRRSPGRTERERPPRDAPRRPGTCPRAKP